MGMIGMVLVIIGVIISVIGGLWFLITAFSESPVWGIGCLLIPFVSLFFLVLHFDKAGKPFGVNVIGMLIAVAGAMMSGGGSGGWQS